MDQIKWDISREGRAWQGNEAVERHNLQHEPTRIEMHQGKLFLNDEERITVIAMLMENLGIDRILPLIDPGLYLDALLELGIDNEQVHQLIGRLEQYVAQSQKRQFF